MIYILSIIIVLGVLVFVHELGHFLAAKFFGVRVERFSIGFPPRLFGIQIGETDYCLSWIPLGGYVKLSGMIDESMDDSMLEEEPKPYEFRAKATYQKVIIISAGVIMNFLLAVAILASVSWIQGEAIMPSTTIGKVVEGSIYQEAGFQKGDQILEVGGKPVAHWQEIKLFLLESLGSDVLFKINRAGQMQELIIKERDLKLDNIDKPGIEVFYPARVGILSPGYPAQEAGLQEGDQIIAINDTSMQEWTDMTKFVHVRPEIPLVFTILRGNETLKVDIMPKSTIVKNSKGEEQTLGIVGIRPYEHREVAFWTALGKGYERALWFGKINIKGLFWIISGKQSPKKMLMGPIGITKLAGDMAQESFFNLIPLIAQLSIVLAFVNILPIPALDGGHLLIILIEGIRRKPISIKAKMIVQQIGMIFLLMLMFFVIYNDLARMLSDAF